MLLIAVVVISVLLVLLLLSLLSLLLLLLLSCPAEHSFSHPLGYDALVAHTDNGFHRVKGPRE